MVIWCLLLFFSFFFRKVNFAKVDSRKTDYVLEIKVNSGDPYIMYEDEFHEVCSVRRISTKIWFTKLNNNCYYNYYYIIFLLT